MRVYDEMTTTYADQSKWTLPEVLRDQARTHGDRTYLSVPEAAEEYSFSEMLDLSERVAAGLLAGGAVHGDRLVIMAPNSSRWMFAWYGAAMGGIATVAINTAYRGEFLRHQVATSGAVGAVIDASYADRFVDLVDVLPSLQTVYVVGEAQEQQEAVASLERAGWRASAFDSLLSSSHRELPSVAFTDLASVAFTSGTTGLSKGAMMPHAQMYFFAHQCTNVTRIGPDDVYLASGPLFHANASILAAYASLIAGCKFVLYSKFSAAQWTTWMRENRATVTNFVSVMMEFVWKQPQRADDRDNQLRCIFAVPTAHGLIDGFRERFGVGEFVETCGMTEISCVIMSPYGEKRPVGAAGLAVGDYFDVRIVDPDTDREVPNGVVGEMVVRPKIPWITCQGYIGMPDKTVETWRNLWFHTGDGLRRDDDGWFYYVDRLKDTIRRRGENISSLELEQALLHHPDLLDCACIAVSAGHEAGEDEVLAVLVPAPGVTIDLPALSKWIEKEVPSFAVPRFLRILDELPKTPSGKTRKGPLRDLGTDGAVDRAMLSSGRLTKP